MLERYDTEMNAIEDGILKGTRGHTFRLNEIRDDLLDLRRHYAQLIDMAQEFEENENGLFQTKNLRFSHLFTERVSRLQEMVTSLREYSVQLRDLVQSQMSAHQNNIMTLLTVVTTVFMPLTLITGWYGNELPPHAGTGIAAGLSGDDRRFGAGRGRLSALLQAAQVALAFL